MVMSHIVSELLRRAISTIYIFTTWHCESQIVVLLLQRRPTKKHYLKRTISLLLLWAELPH